jgi:hypothetical protein
MSRLSGRKLLRRASVRSPSAVLLLQRKRVRSLNHSVSSRRRGHRKRTSLSRKSLSGKMRRSRRSNGGVRSGVESGTANISGNLGGIFGYTTLTVYELRRRSSFALNFAVYFAL